MIQKWMVPPNIAPKGSAALQEAVENNEITAGAAAKVVAAPSDHAQQKAAAQAHRQGAFFSSHHWRVLFLVLARC